MKELLANVPGIDRRHDDLDKPFGSGEQRRRARRIFEREEIRNTRKARRRHVRRFRNELGTLKVLTYLLTSASSDDDERSSRALRALSLRYRDAETSGEVIGKATAELSGLAESLRKVSA